MLIDPRSKFRGQSLAPPPPSRVVAGYGFRRGLKNRLLVVEADVKEARLVRIGFERRVRFANNDAAQIRPLAAAPQCQVDAVEIGESYLGHQDVRLRAKQGRLGFEKRGCGV